MPTWLKVLLGGLLAGLLLLGAVIGVGAWWLHKHKAELVRDAKNAIEEGKVFGRHQTQSGCVDEGLRRAQSLNGIADELRNMFFARGCMQGAAASPNFCDGVPSETEIMPTVHWRAAVCKGRTASDPQRCRRFLQSWQQFCEYDAKRK